MFSRLQSAVKGTNRKVRVLRSRARNKVRTGGGVSRTVHVTKFRWENILLRGVCLVQQPVRFCPPTADHNISSDRSANN